MRRATIFLLTAASIDIACGDVVGPEPVTPAEVRARPAPSADRISDPIALLQGAQRFESAAIGYAGQPSEYAAAWKQVLASPHASRRFRDLLETARTVPGRLYGLAGLQYTDPAAVRAWRETPPAWVAGEVDILFGCIGGRIPVVALLPQVADGTWIRDWSVDSIPPPPPT